MRKFLMVIGATALLLIAAAGTGIGFLIYRGNQLDTESRAFVDRAIPAITANWNTAQFRERASPDLLKGLRPGQLSALFHQFSALGPLIKYEGAKGQANMAYFTWSGATISAGYAATAVFANGTATIKVLLVKRGRHWLIRGFHVDSKLSGAGRRRV